MKWGIIGLGSIAHKFASELLLEKEEVYAVASRSLDKAKEFASQYQCSHYYGSYDEILEDENIDIIYVATPHNLHQKLH
jgi:predicted dehydrogenase